MPRHTRRSAAAAAAAAEASDTVELSEPAAKRAKTGQPFVAGDSLPKGEVVNQDGEPVNLARDFSSGLLVIYAYPKASTPGCSRQTVGFGGYHGKLKSLGAAVFGISADSPKSQTTFRKTTGIDFDLLSDPDYKLLEPLGAKKSPKGVVRSHWVFLDGKAELVEHQVKPDSSPEQIVHFIKQLTGNVSDFELQEPGESRVASESADAPPAPAEKLAAEPLEKLAEGPADEAKPIDESKPEGTPQPESDSKPGEPKEEAKPDETKSEEPKPEETKSEEPKPEETRPEAGSEPHAEHAQLNESNGTAPEPTKESGVPKPEHSTA